MLALHEADFVLVGFLHEQAELCVERRDTKTCASIVQRLILFITRGIAVVAMGG